MGRVSRYLSQADRIIQFEQHMASNEKFRGEAAKELVRLGELAEASRKTAEALARDAQAADRDRRTLHINDQEHMVREGELRSLLYLIRDAVAAPWFSRRRWRARRALRELARDVGEADA